MCMKKLIEYILLLPIFLKLFVIRSNIVPFDLYLIDIIIIVSLPILLYRLKKYNKILFYIYFFILIFSYLHYLKDAFLVKSIIKQFVNILIYYTYFYLVFIFFKRNLYSIVSVYTNILICVCIIGLIQFIAYHLNINYLYDYSFILPEPWIVREVNNSIRINSLFTEPSFFGYQLSLVLPISLYNLINNKNIIINRYKSIIIILSLLITQSAIAYIGLLLSLTLITVKKINLKTFFTFSSLILLIVITTLQIESIRVRFIDTYVGLTKINEGEINQINLSSFALVNNIYVAVENFKESPLIGSGFGSHSKKFDKISLQHHTSEDANKDGANSMILRLISEFGIVGILFYFLYLKMYWLPFKQTNQLLFLYLINKGSFVYILLIGLRMGTFGFQSLPLVFFIYIYSYRYAKKENSNRLIMV